MHYVDISTYQFILYYASAIHKLTHTRILKPSEDSERTGLKVDIAMQAYIHMQSPEGRGGTKRVLLVVLLRYKRTPTCSHPKGRVAPSE